jgi:hypothetical protein
MSNENKSEPFLKEEQIKIFPDVIRELRVKLNNIENNYERRFTNLLRRIEKNERTDIKIESLFTTQTDQIKIKSNDLKTIITTRSLLLSNNNKLQEYLSDKADEIFIDQSHSYIEAILEILRQLNKEKTKKIKITIFLQKSLKEGFISFLDDIFSEKDLLKNIKSSLVFRTKGGSGEGSTGDYAFNPTTKSNNIQLSNKNMTATMTGSSTHSTVLGTKFTEGRHIWRIRINRLGDSNWIILGISEQLTHYNDNQSNNLSINIRGGDYDANQMTPQRPPNLADGDILTCILDFDEDSFIMKGPSSKPFLLKNSKSIKGKMLFIMVELYYINSSVTLLEED